LIGGEEEAAVLSLVFFFDISIDLRSADTE
jgi:hypothetical protein